MPVTNIIDHRSNNYCVDIDAAFEDTWHDNSIVGATQFPIEDNEVTIYFQFKTTVDLAIKYAAKEFPNNSVTLFLYDSGHLSK